MAFTEYENESFVVLEVNSKTLKRVKQCQKS